MIVNLKKFLTMVITRRSLQNNNVTLSINNMTKKAKISVERLGVTIDEKLLFEEHKNTKTL